MVQYAFGKHGNNDGQAPDDNGDNDSIVQDFSCFLHHFIRGEGFRSKIKGFK